MEQYSGFTCIRRQRDKNWWEHTALHVLHDNTDSMCVRWENHKGSTVALVVERRPPHPQELKAELGSSHATGPGPVQIRVIQKLLLVEGSICMKDREISLVNTKISHCYFSSQKVRFFTGLVHTFVSRQDRRIEDCFPLQG